MLAVLSSWSGGSGRDLTQCLHQIVINVLYILYYIIKIYCIYSALWALKRIEENDRLSYHEYFLRIKWPAHRQEIDSHKNPSQRHRAIASCRSRRERLAPSKWSGAAALYHYSNRADVAAISKPFFGYIRAIECIFIKNQLNSKQPNMNLTLLLALLLQATVQAAVCTLKVCQQCKYLVDSPQPKLNLKAFCHRQLNGCCHNYRSNTRTNSLFDYYHWK